MSRIGLKPVPIPKGVELKRDGRDLTVKGPKGELRWTLPHNIEMTEEDGRLVFERKTNDRQARADYGLSRAMVNNLVTGVSDGFERKLLIEGVGYRANLKGKTLELTLGFSHPISYPVPDGIEIDVESPVSISVKGADKQQVGQVAAEIRKFRPPEPYKGKGIRYGDERIRRKAGKTAV